MKRRDFTKTILGFLVVPLAALITKKTEAKPVQDVDPEFIRKLAAPLRSGVLSDNLMDKIFENQELPQGAAIEFPLDFLKEDRTFTGHVADPEETDPEQLKALIKEMQTEINNKIAQGLYDDYWRSYYDSPSVVFNRRHVLLTQVAE